jgi:hypothetical protein
MSLPSPFVLVAAHAAPIDIFAHSDRTNTHIADVRLGPGATTVATRSASTTLSTLNDSFGLFASIPRYPRYVRFTPDSDRIADIHERQLCARSRNMQCSKESLFDHLVGASEERWRHVEPWRS